jgi:hypothetical protein
MKHQDFDSFKQHVFEMNEARQYTGMKEDRYIGQILKSLLAQFKNSKIILRVVEQNNFDIAHI